MSSSAFAAYNELVSGGIPILTSLIVQESSTAVLDTGNAIAPGGVNTGSAAIARIAVKRIGGN